MSHTIKVLIVDDHEVLRDGVRAIIERQPSWSVVGEAGTGRDAIDQARKLMPDVIVMDVSMPELNGIDATRQIRSERPETQVVILTMHHSDDVVFQAIEAGACCVGLKDDGREVILAAVRSALEHKHYFSPAIAQIVVNGFMRSADAEGSRLRSLLSLREREVLQLIAEGSSTKDVARTLDLSIKTAETHRSNMMKKIGARSVAEVVRYAVRNGVVQP